MANKTYFASSVNLTPGASPQLTLTVLETGGRRDGLPYASEQHVPDPRFLAVFAGAILVFLISRTITHPLDNLVQGVRALEQGNYHYPLGPGTGDEVVRSDRRVRSHARHLASERRAEQAARTPVAAIAENGSGGTARRWRRARFQ